MQYRSALFGGWRQVCCKGSMAGAVFLWAAMAMAGPNVLLLWDDTNDMVSELPPSPNDPGLNWGTQDLIQALAGSGIQVTLSSTSQDTYMGYEPPPVDFDVVVHLNSNASGKILNSGGAAVLEDYVKQGGGYVGAECNATYLQIPSLYGGMDERMAPLTPLEITGGEVGEALALTADTNAEGHAFYNAHQLLAGPLIFEGDHMACKVREYASEPATTTVIYRDQYDYPAVAVRAHDLGRVVGFHFVPNMGGHNTLSWSAVKNLYINAVYWADQKPPSVQAIETEDGPRTPGSDLVFIVRFSEGVGPVAVADFSVLTTRTATYDEPLQLTVIDDRQCQVTVANVQGEGSYQLKVLDRDTIRDQSVSTNPLGGVGEDNGEYAGPEVFVDNTPPDVNMLVVGGNLAPLESTPVLVFQFNESMDQTVAPALAIQTESGGSFQALPGSQGGDGAWASETEYRVSLDRPITEDDEGVAVVQVSAARDLAGNAVAPSQPLHFGIIDTELRLEEDLHGPKIVVMRGGRLHLQIAAAGALGALHYQWYRQNSSKVDIQVGEDLPRLMLDNVIESHGGVYYCVVSDSLKTLESSHVELVVEIPDVPASGGLSLAAGALLTVLLGRRRLRRI